jgi:cyclase
MFRTPHFATELVAKGVWAAIAPPESGASCNAGIVDLGSDTLVFDAFRTPPAAADLRSAASMVSGRTPSIVVNSHWHPSHTFGNATFGSCTIFGTEKTRVRINDLGPVWVATVEDPDWGNRMAGLQSRHDGEQNPLRRREITAELAARNELWGSRDRVRVRPPDRIFQDRHQFPGNRGVSIVEGGGHSESDSVVFVSDVEVLFAGDLVSVGTHPNLVSADLARWQTTLEKFEKIAPQFLVPGHGPVAGVESCSVLSEYLRRIEEIARDDTAPEIPEEYADWEFPGHFFDGVAVLRARRAGVAFP